MIELKKYNDSLKPAWDNLVRHSRNGTFLLCRDFIEYHADRFSDCSVMFYQNNNLLAVLPGHIQGKKYISHAGLTYGGLIVGISVRTAHVLEIFHLLTGYLKSIGIQELIYKAIPHIYHKYPCEEDLYALFTIGAKLTARSISSGIYLADKLQYNNLRKRSINKAIKNNLQTGRSACLAGYWTILEENLREKHNTQPVHTLSEMQYLQSRFPDEIRLYTVCENNDILAGCITFATPVAVHIQYIAATGQGKKKGAVDMLVDYIINTFHDRRFFDYGISTEDNGLYLNKNLIAQKEGFGARGIIYDIYSVVL